MASASPARRTPQNREGSERYSHSSSPKPESTTSDEHDDAIPDLEALHLIDEYLWHSEIQDLFLGRQSFARICESLGSDDIADVVARCLSLLVESVHGMDDPVVERGQWLRVDTLMALQYIGLGCSLAEDSPCDTFIPLMRSASEMFYHEGVLRCMVLLLDKFLDSSYMLTRKRDHGYLSEVPRPCELLLARELRCCFNVIYVCLLFNLHRLDFLEECLVGSARAGPSISAVTSSYEGVDDEDRSLLDSLIFATRFALDLREFPIRKLLLCDLLLWRTTLEAPDRWLYLMTPNTPEKDLRRCRKSARGPPSISQTECSVLLGEFPASEPKLKDFQAFVVLCLHENFILSKEGCRRPTPIKEALTIVNDYQDRFLRSYAFHAAEVEFLRRNSTALADIYTRFLSLKARGLIKYRIGLTRVQRGGEHSRFSIQQLVKHLLPNWENRLVEQRQMRTRSLWRKGLRVPTAPPTRRGRRHRKSCQANKNEENRIPEEANEEEVYDDRSSVVTSSSEASSNASLDPEVMDAGFRLLRQAADEMIEDEEEEEVDEEDEPSPEDVVSLEDFVHSLSLNGGSSNDTRGGGGLKMDAEDVKHMVEGVTRWTPAEDHEELLDAICGDNHSRRFNWIDHPDVESPERSAEISIARIHLIERFYKSLLPKLESLFSTLQQLCLSALQNPTEYPNTIDLSVERTLLHKQQVVDGEQQRRPLPSEDHPENVSLEELMLADGAVLASACLRRRPEERLEMQRHADIITAAVTGMAVCLLKGSRLLSLQRFCTIADCFCKNNLALVLLKILQGMDETSVRPYEVPPVLPCLRTNSRTSEISRKADGDAVATETLQNAMPSPVAESYWRATSVIYVVCRDSPETVRKILVQFRFFTSLVKMFRTPNRQIQKVAYKLFKKQVRFYPRKLKMNSMSAISSAYNIVRTNPIEDWVLSSPLHAENHREEGLILDFSSSLTDYAPSVDEFRKYNGSGPPVVVEHEGPEGTLATHTPDVSVDHHEELLHSIESELNPAEMPQQTSRSMIEYCKLISLVDWADPDCVDAFLQATGMSPEECFYGYKSFDAWVAGGFSSSKSEHS